MNTKENAIIELNYFLKSDDQTLLLTGTHQVAKHVLALQIVFASCSQSKILFRTGSSRDYEDYLSPVMRVNKRLKSGTAYPVGSGNILYLDTINSASWGKTPRSIDIGIVYPIDVLNEKEGDMVVHDFLRRGVRKIILVSWTDNKDYAWVEQFNPKKVLYDAEAERPEYHREVTKYTTTKSKPSFVYNLPKYASSTPHEYLVRILCRNCNKTRWAKMNKTFTGMTAIRQAKFGEIEANCLMCGYRATDNYNWSR